MSEVEKLTSYSASRGPLAAVGHSLKLVRHHRSGLDARVAAVVEECEEIEREAFEIIGTTLSNRRILDIGPGQRLMQMAYFAARGNDVVGVDRDLIVHGFDPTGYWRMARSNGLTRAVKTVGRKLLGIDRSYRKALQRQLRTTERVPRLTVLQRNAWETGLQANSFDFIYSLRTFMHIHKPAAALDEAARLLAPGGIAYIHLMPYTGPTGCLDIGMLGGAGEKLPPWAHLRPQYRHLVRESAHLNRMGLSDWRNLIAQAMPGSTLRLAQPGHDQLRPLAERLHRRGELVEFSVDDLVTSGVHITWRKVKGVLAHLALLSDTLFDAVARYGGWVLELAGFPLAS